MKNDRQNPVQYCQDYDYPGERQMNMTKRGSMTGVTKGVDNPDLQSKIINSTDRTERRSDAPPAKQAFSTLAKSGYPGMPNNHGSPVTEGIYKPGGKR